MRVGNEVVHFNLNKILTRSDTDEANCMTVENFSPANLKLNFECNIQHSINENEMIF